MVEAAWHVQDRHRVSFWDALILAAAERTGSRYVLSEDFEDGRHYGRVEAVSPFSRAPGSLDAR